MSNVMAKSSFLNGTKLATNARAPQARANRAFTVYARKTMDRISLPQDGKWRSQISFYPEWGSYPDQGRDSPVFDMTYDDYKENVEREVIHGRFAMLAVSGIITQEQFTGVPWWKAGEMCTLDHCQLQYLDFQFKEINSTGGIFALFFFEIALFGLAEAYRGGLLPNPFKDGLDATAYPGGRFDPLNFASPQKNPFGEPLDVMKVKELKHGRLAMLAFMGCFAQYFSTNTDTWNGDLGALDNLSGHLNNVYTCNVYDRSGC